MNTQIKIFDFYCKKFKIFFYILFLYASTVMAQQEIPIWKDKPIYSIAPDSAKEISKKYNIMKHDITHVSKVVQPSITYFLPDKPNGTAVLIFPGGGYSLLAWDYEGTLVAEWLKKLGITAIVVKYRLPDDVLMNQKSIVPLADGLEAIALIREKAAQWKLDPKKIGVMGFSAGGHLAATISNHYDDFENGKYLTSGKPDFSILVYPVIFSDENGHKDSSNTLLGKHPSEKELAYFDNAAQVDTNTPPAILFHSSNDTAVPVENSIAYYKALRKQKKSVEMHIYEDGGHGFGLLKASPGNSYKNWDNDLINWLKNRDLIQ